MNGGGSGSGGLSLLGYLRSELVLLANEARRKSPEEVDKVLESIDVGTDGVDSARVSQALAKRVDVLKALTLACQCSNSARLIPGAINIIHRLISHTAISPDENSIMAALDILDRAVGASDQVQLRSLQCIMPLLTHYTNIHQANLFKSYDVCFRLQASKSTTVVNAAVAIIRQLIIWLFEKVTDEDTTNAQAAASLVKVAKDDKTCPSLPPFTADAFVIFQDICLLANGEKALVLPLVSISRNFALELIESVLAYHSQVFRRNQELCFLVRDKICTLAVRRFTEKCDFPQTCRLWRVVGILLREFHDILCVETEIFLSFLVKFFEENVLVWEKALALETCREIFSNFYLVTELYSVCQKGQSGSKLFQELIVCVNNLILGTTVKVSHTDLAYQKVALKVPLLQQFDKGTPPSITDPYLLLIAYETLSNFLAGILNALTPLCRLPDSQRLAALAPEEETAETRIAKLLLGNSWAALLRSMSTVLSGCRLDSEWQANVLTCFQNFAQIEAMLQMGDALSATLKLLVELSFPEYQQATGKSPVSMGSLLVSDLNLASSVMILKMSLIIDELLNESWIQVMRIVHSNDQFAVLKAKKMVSDSAATLPSSGKNSSGHGSVFLNSDSGIELDQLGELTDLGRRIIENSQNLSEQSFEHFLRALCQLSSEMISAPSSSTSMTNVRLTMVLFPVQKLKQVVLLNTHRFVTAQQVSSWDIAIAQLVMVTRSSDTGLRGLGCEAVSLFIAQFSAAVDPAVFGSSGMLQVRVLEPLHQILEQSEWADAQKTALESLQRFLQHVGPHLSHGWKVVFQILNNVMAPEQGTPSSQSIVRPAFASVKLVCAEFLAGLDAEAIRDTVSVLRRFALVVDDLNISLTAIGLLWDVADHVRQRSPTVKNGVEMYDGVGIGDNFQLWVFILNQFLALAKDSRPEIRNSSIQTMTRAIEIGGNSLNECEWAVVFDESILLLLEEHCDQFIISTETTAAANPVAPARDENVVNLTHHSRDSVEKQWNETQLLLIQGVTQLYTQFFQTIVGLELFYSVYWDKILLKITELCRSDRSSELTAVAIESLLKLVASQEGLGECHKPLWDRAWVCWCDVGCAMSLSAKSFTQEALVKFAKMFNYFLSVQKAASGVVEKTWLAQTWGVLDRVLSCPTPADTIKDLDSLTDLQRRVLEDLDSAVDYDGAGRDARSLYLGQLAGWLGWLQELSGIEMTSNSSLRRSRIATQASFNSAVKTIGHAAGCATYVALSMAALERLRKRTVLWAEDQNIYKDGAFQLIIRGLGELMLLKYRAPSGSGPISLWKLAARTFNSILASILPKLDTILEYPSGPDPYIEAIWEELVGVIDETLEMGQMQVPRDLALEQLEADEEFDVGQVLFIRETIIPLMVHASLANVQTVLEAFARNSHLYTSRSVDSGHSDGEPTFIGDALPVIKEKFAIACLETLFLICMDPGSSDGNRLCRKGERGRQLSEVAEFVPSGTLSAIPACVVQQGLLILMRRCESVLENYAHDKCLLGRMPFARVRQDEMLFILQQLNTLRLPAGIDLFPTVQRPKTCQRLLETPLGHLFYMYPKYCKCLNLEDASITQKVQQAFLLIGAQLGIMEHDR